MGSLQNQNEGDVNREPRFMNRKAGARFNDSPCNPSLLALDREDLPPLIIAASRADGVARNCAPALRTFGQLGGMPTIGRLARAQSHLGGFAFWNSHGSRLRKHSGLKRQRESTLVNRESV